MYTPVFPLKSMVPVFRDFEPIVQAQAGQNDPASTQGFILSGSAASALDWYRARSTDECSRFQTTGRVVGLLQAAEILGPDLSEEADEDVELASSRAEGSTLTSAESACSASSDSEGFGMNSIGEPNTILARGCLYMWRTCV